MQISWIEVPKEHTLIELLKIKTKTNKESIFVSYIKKHNTVKSIKKQWGSLLVTMHDNKTHKLDSKGCNIVAYHKVLQLKRFRKDGEIDTLKPYAIHQKVKFSFIMNIYFFIYDFIMLFYKNWNYSYIIDQNEVREKEYKNTVEFLKKNEVVKKNT